LTVYCWLYLRCSTRVFVGVDLAKQADCMIGRPE
jgi:hypothetical protein